MMKGMVVFRVVSDLVRQRKECGDGEARRTASMSVGMSASLLLSYLPPFLLSFESPG